MKKVLFVDDDNDFLETMKRKFAGKLDADYFLTGSEGLERLKHTRYDAVVLDLRMGVDGTTFVRLANGRLRDSKVYFMSCEDINDIEKKIEPVKERVAGIFNKLNDFHLLEQALVGEEVMQ